MTSGVTSPLLTQSTLSTVANNLKSEIAAVTGLNPSVVTGTGPSSGDIFLTLAANGSLGTEGYTETVTSTTVTISAPTSTGAYYGGKSLQQLLRATSTGHRTVPVGTISDYPSVGYRSVMLDVGRRFWPVADIQDEIRRMSWNKQNVLHLHLNEDEAFRLYLPGTAYANLAPTSEAYRYGPEDIDAILAVATANHVVVVPEIDTPAHALAVTLSDTNRSLQSKCGGAYAQVVDFTSPSVVTWVSGLYTEAASRFPGPYFHIGGDEVEQLDDCTYIQNSGKTGIQWQTEFENTLNTAIKATGKRTMLWAVDTDLQPNLDIILTDFGGEDEALRALGYDVVSQARGLSVGMPDSSYFSLYGQDTATGAHALGTNLAVWGDSQPGGQDSRFVLKEMLLNQYQIAERSWNVNPTTISESQWQTKVDATGDAPLARAIEQTAVTTNGKPVHRYSFDSTYTPPNAASLKPEMWNPALGPVRVGHDLSFADSASTLFGTSQYWKPSLTTSGHTGSALQLTGDVSVTIPDGANPSSWTISGWVRRTADKDYSNLIGNHFGAIKLEQYGANHKVGITRYGVADWSFNYVVPLNTWTHLAVVADGTAGTTTLYANGSNVGSVSAVIDYPVSAVGGFPAYAGQLDDLTIYHQALSSSQVTADYNGTTSVSKISTNATATATSTEAPSLGAANAIDNDLSTRWSSDYSDPQDLTIDLGSTRTVNRVELVWQYAAAATYELRVSTNGTTWTTVASRTGGSGVSIGQQRIENLSSSARYVQVHGLTRATGYGYSLFDVSVYGS